MNDNPPANGSRSSDPYGKLRLVALIAAIVGVILLAALAFVLSYGGIHALARQAGMSANMARLFPLIFDAMLVVSCVAVLLLRGAGWWRRGYAWLITIVLLVAVAAGDAVHAAGTHLPRRPAAITAAVLPWVLLLLAFSLLLAMLRQFRHRRAAVARQQAAAKTEPAATLTPSAAPAAGRTGLDDLFNRDWAVAPVIGNKTAADVTQPASVPAAIRTQTSRRPAEAEADARQNGAAEAKSAESAWRTITQPIAPTGTTKSAAAALDAADKPANTQSRAPAAGKAAAAAGAAAAALVSRSGQRPADEASAAQPAAGQASPAPGTQPVTATQDQPADQAPATQTPANEAATKTPADQAPDTETPANEAATKTPADEAADTETPADEAADAETPANEAPATRTPADEAADAETPANEAPVTQAPAEKPTADEAAATQAPADRESSEQADEPAPAARPPTDETSAEQRTADKGPADEASADETDADETDADQTPAAQGAADKTPADQTPADQRPADEPHAEPAGPANGAAIRVPQQPVRAPVPAPSPHFDRLRSTPTSPDEDNDTDS
jgi:Protein of unknown function (DUF2637)